MKKKINYNQLKKNVGISIIAQVISLLVSFVMNLILPKFISEYQYALWQTYLLYVGYVGVLHFGLLDGIALRYSQYDYDELDKPRIRSQFKCLLAMTSFSSLLVIGIAGIMSSGEMRLVFIMIGLGIVTKSVYTYTSNSFQITNRIMQYAKMVIGYRLFYGLGAIVMLFLGLREYYYFCIVDLCSDVFGVLYALRNNKGMYFGTSLKIRDALSEAKQNISAGIKLMISNWSSLMLTGGARIIIQLHWDKIVFGKVSFAFSITNLFLTFVTAISIVLFPSLKRTSEEELPVFYSKIRNVMNPFLISIMALYYPGCWILSMWLPQYNNSLVYLGILLPIIIFSSKINLLTNNYLKTMRKEKIMLGINLFSVGVALCCFAFSAFVLNNLRVLLVFIVVAIMLCSILSELVVMNSFNMLKVRNFVCEILMTFIFIATTNINSRWIGFIVYIIAVIIYLLLINKTKIIRLKKFNH